MKINKRNRQVVSVDKETGEVLDGIFVHFGLKRNPYSKGWVMNSQEALTELAKDKELKGETYRVLLYLLGQLDFENWILIQASQICKELDMQRQHVSRAIILLEKKGIIVRGEKLGRSYAFHLNPHYGWKGKVSNLDDYRQKEDDKALRESHRKNANLSLVKTEEAKSDQPTKEE